MEIISWNLENNRRKVQKEEGFDLFNLKDYEIKRPTKRGPNSPESEIRELISKLINKPIPYTCGKTRGMTHQQMYEMYTQATSWKVNPQALMNKFLKKYNEIQRTKKVGRKSAS